MGRVWFSRAKPRPVKSSTIAAAVRERVGPEPGGQEAEHLGLAGQRVLGHDSRRGRTVVRGPGDPVVDVGVATRRRAGDLPTVQLVTVGLEGRRALAGRHLDVVDGHAGALDGVIADVADRHLRRAPGEVRQVDRPLLPAVAAAADRVPHPRGARRRAPTAAGGLVAGQARVQAEPVRARVTGVVRRVAVDVRQRGVVGLAVGAGFDGDEVPVGLGLPVHPEGEGGAATGNGDRPAQALEGGALGGGLREGEAGPRVRGHGRQQVGVDGVDIVDPAGTTPRIAVLGQVELADVDGGQVRGHGRRRVPHPCGQAGVALLAHQGAVGHHLEAVGDRDLEPEPGLVAGVVVGREPDGGHMGLAGHQDPVVGRQPPTPAIDGGQRLRDAAVVHDDLDPFAMGDPAARRDLQLTVAPLERRGHAVDGHAVHGQAIEVEVEAGQVPLGPEVDGGQAGEHVGVRVVAQLQVVGADVVAPVAVEGEVRVADPRRALLVRRREGLGRAGRADDRQEEDGEYGREQGGALHLRRLCRPRGGGQSPRRAQTGTTSAMVRSSSTRPDTVGVCWSTPSLNTMSVAKDVRARLLTLCS